MSVRALEKPLICGFFEGFEDIIEWVDPYRCTLTTDGDVGTLTLTEGNYGNVYNPLLAPFDAREFRYAEFRVTEMTADRFMVHFLCQGCEWGADMEVTSPGTYSFDLLPQLYSPLIIEAMMRVSVNPPFPAGKYAKIDYIMVCKELPPPTPPVCPPCPPWLWILGPIVTGMSMGMEPRK